MEIKKSLLVFFCMAIVALSSGCLSSSEEVSGDSIAGVSSRELEISIDKLEIIHFHGTNQCYSCVTVGDFAEETVNTYFKKEVESGVIEFKHINGDLPKNQEITRKYGTTGSSIWLGVYEGNNFEAEQNINVWYKISNKQEFMTYFKGVIEQKLEGN